MRRLWLGLLFVGSTALAEPLHVTIGAALRNLRGVILGAVGDRPSGDEAGGGAGAASCAQ